MADPMVAAIRSRHEGQMVSPLRNIANAVLEVLPCLEIAADDTQDSPGVSDVLTEYRQDTFPSFLRIMITSGYHSVIQIIMICATTTTSPTRVNALFPPAGKIHKYLQQPSKTRISFTYGHTHKLYTSSHKPTDTKQKRK